jgi:ATP-binding cassette, subfamily B (MDR/TAP), member 1
LALLTLLPMDVSLPAYDIQYSSWRVALVVLAFLPVVSVAAMFLMTLNQSRGNMTSKSYKQAGSIAYSAVASVKTVLSLNAILPMVEAYKEATRTAYKESLKFVVKLGFANGTFDDRTRFE